MKTCKTHKKYLYGNRWKQISKIRKNHKQKHTLQKRKEDVYYDDLGRLDKPEATDRTNTRYIPVN